MFFFVFRGISAFGIIIVYIILPHYYLFCIYIALAKVYVKPVLRLERVRENGNMIVMHASF
jgi:hypothetical protein